MAFNFVIKDTSVVNAPFKATKDGQVNLLPPVPDAVIKVGQVETFLAGIPIVNELPTSPALGELIIYTGEEL